MSNYENGNGVKKGVNTRLIQIYNENDGDFSGTLRLGFYNNYASIYINPILDKSDRKNGKVYDYEKTSIALLDIEQLILLQNGIKLLERDIKNEKEGKERKIFSVAVKTNSTVIKVGHGEYDDLDSYYLFLFSLDDNKNIIGYIPYSFTDKNNSLLVNFDEDSNKGKSKKINSQWEMFKKFIDYSIDNLINGGAHGVNNLTDYKFNRIEKDLKEIKDNLNISGSNSSSGGRNNAFRSGSMRRRNSTRIENVDDEEFMKDVEEVDGEEYEFNSNYDDEEVAEEKPSKKSKSSSKKSAKSNKKIRKEKVSLDDISNEMSEDLEDLGDID